jgi:LmbE family N-acetylglucosaminyl deacetylase
MKRFAHTAIFPAIETANLGILKLVGILRPANVRRISFTGGGKIFVLAPHPDDETLGCGGIIPLHLRAGDDVRIAIVTDGRRSRAGGLDADTMVAVRAREAQNAIKVLQCENRPHNGNLELMQYMLPEGSWRMAELVDMLIRQISEWKPTIIYSTSRVDFHPEHLRVASALAQALQSGPVTPMIRIRAYELQVPLTSLLANVFADISSSSSKKGEALAQYRSQQGSFLWVRRHSRYLRAIFGVRGPLEVFWEMDAQQFIAGHMGDELRSRFRSIRLRPFTDLLAWVVGRNVRRALRTKNQGKSIR